jgi:hypothetical protein
MGAKGDSAWAASSDDDTIDAKEVFVSRPARGRAAGRLLWVGCSGVAGTGVDDIPCTLLPERFVEIGAEVEAAGVAYEVDAMP